MKNPDLYDKRDNFIRSYNKYNLLRYGDKHNMFNTIDDIMVYWRGGAGEERGNKQRINRKRHQAQIKPNKYNLHKSMKIPKMIPMTKVMSKKR